jgi:4-aminobutyrate aminotransferase-like enzyme
MYRSIYAAASATLDVLVEEKLPERVAELGKYLMENLQGFTDEYRIVREVRGPRAHDLC